MADKEDFFYKVKIKCSHCGEINEIPHLDFKSALLGNHFYKMICSNPKCGKRTMVTYAFMTIPYEYGDVPEKTLSKITIPVEIVEVKKTEETIT